MIKLTDTQLKVLTDAADQADGAASVPPGLPKAAAAKVAASLVTRKMMREIRSKVEMPVWREDGDGRSMSLVILRAGRDALSEHLEANGAATTAARTDEVQVAEKAADPGSTTPPNGPPQPLPGEPNTDLHSNDVDVAGKGPQLVAASDGRPAKPHGLPRAGSKQSLVIEMLSGSDGASISALVEATGWLPHTTRAVLSGLRKRGYEINRDKSDGGSVYRIVGKAPVTEAA